MPSPQYFKVKYKQLASQACTVDTTPPTFSGIASVTAQNDGTFVVTWAAATSTKTPVRYEIYVALGSVSAGSLFVTANRVAFAPGLLTSWRIGWLRDQTTYFVNGLLYTFGIRSVDAQNYSDSNVAILTSTAIASGNIGGLFQTIETNMAATEVLLASDEADFDADLAILAADLITLTNAATGIAATEVLLAADHANFVTDNSNFVSRNAELIARNAELVADHANFVADISALSAVESALSSTAAAISATEVLLAADEADFDADLVRFESDLSEFESDLVMLLDATAAVTGIEETLISTVGELEASVAILVDATNTVNEAASGIAEAHENLDQDHLNFVEDLEQLENITHVLTAATTPCQLIAKVDVPKIVAIVTECENNC